MSEKRMVYAEDVIQRIRDLAPEILGGWYNPDMENELEQLFALWKTLRRQRRRTPSAGVKRQKTRRQRQTQTNLEWCWPLQPGILELGITKMWKHGLLILSHYFQKTSRFGCRFRNYRGRLKSE